MLGRGTLAKAVERAIEAQTSVLERLVALDRPSIDKVAQLSASIEQLLSTAARLGLLEAPEGERTSPSIEAPVERLTPSKRVSAAELRAGVVPYCPTVATARYTDIGDRPLTDAKTLQLDDDDDEGTAQLLDEEWVAPPEPPPVIGGGYASPRQGIAEDYELLGGTTSWNTKESTPTPTTHRPRTFQSIAPGRERRPKPRGR